EHLAQPAAAGTAVGVVVVAPAVDDVAEAVANRDLRDLAQAAEVALLRPRGHVQSVTRPPTGGWLRLVNPCDRGGPRALRRLNVGALADLAAEQRGAGRRRR